MGDLAGINIMKWRPWHVVAPPSSCAAALVIICVAVKIDFIDRECAAPQDYKLTVGTKSWGNLPPGL